MKPVKFSEVTATYGQDQPGYVPLPAYRDMTDPLGRMVCCWQLTFWERIKILWTGAVWQQVLTFNRPLQPQQLTIDKPPIKV